MVWFTSYSILRGGGGLYYIFCALHVTQFYVLVCFISYCSGYMFSYKTDAYDSNSVCELILFRMLYRVLILIFNFCNKSYIIVLPEEVLWLIQHIINMTLTFDTQFCDENVLFMALMMRYLLLMHLYYFIDPLWYYVEWMFIVIWCWKYGT